MKTAFLIFSFYIPLLGAAQTRGGAIFFRIVYSHVPHASTMLQRLSPDSIGGFSNSFYGLGTDGFYAWKRARFGFNAILAAQEPSSSGNRYAEPMIGAAHLSAGYVVCSSSKLTVSPQVGVGISGIKFTSYDKSVSDISHLRSAHSIRPSIDAGVNIDLNVYQVTDGLFSTYSILGFRLGYRYSGCSGLWRGRNDDYLRNLKNSFSNNAFYFAIALGMGGFK